MKIILTGGGTGGHLTPLVAIARELKGIAETERIINLDLFYFGPEGTAPELIRNEGIPFRHIAAGKLRRYISPANISDMFKTALGILEALWHVFRVMPDVVFAKGGYGSFPTLFAAHIYRIPVLIHESDAVPGSVNRWAGRWAKRIAVSFARAVPAFSDERTALTGVPIRKRLLGGSIDEARRTFGISSQRPTLFVTGGSQGARILNETVVNALPELLREYEVIHAAGEGNYEDIALETATILSDHNREYYHLGAFLNENEMRSAYALSNLVVSRASATTLFEIAANGKPAIIIPLKNSAQDHQRENAYAYSTAGAAVIIEETNLTPSVLINEVRKLMEDNGQRQRMSEAALAFARPDAAESIAREIITLGMHQPQ